MPPKKAAPAAKSATTTKSKTSTAAAKSAKAAKASATKGSATITTKSTATKRKASELSADEPKTKKAKSATSAPAPKKIAPAKTTTATKTAAPKKAVAPRKKAATKPTSKTAKKVTTTKKAVTEEPVEEPGEAEATQTKNKAKPVSKAAPKKVVAPKAAPKKKALPLINIAPTQKLDVFVFGEGSAGELGLGAARDSAGRKPVDVKRPRLNERLSAKDVGVVQIAVGGMHCAALTFDNKILTWGVNDQGALGRETAQEGKMKDITQKDGDDSDSDSDDDGEGLNPTEAEPREVDPAHFPDGTVFAQLVASDSATFALTVDGFVYGWGTFRGNDGILGFRDGLQAQRTPILIPELKGVVDLATGTNHVLAVTNKGKVLAWGAGEQNQLARRVISRTATGALIPREFGLQRKFITKIGCGDYHCFAVDNKGNTYAWGLNTFGETGISKDQDDENSTIDRPTLVDNLQGHQIKQIVGGAHHSLACTEDGQLLIWGRVDTAQGGMEIVKFPEGDLFYDEHNKPRFLLRPAVIPNINGDYVSAASDTCLVLNTEGRAYSWGFSANFQTGQGTTEDIQVATLIDNTAVRGKRLVFAGAGGQFGVLAGVHEDAVMTNGV